MSAISLPKFGRRFAAGGALPAGPQAAGAPSAAGAGPGAPSTSGQPPQGAAGPDPGQQLQAAVQQYAQSKDPQLAVQIADMLVQLMGAEMGDADPTAAGDPGAGAGGTSMGSPAGSAGPAQLNRQGGKVPPSFGSKAKPGAKPAFAVPAKAPAAGAAAAKAAPSAASGGKPMDALQKLRAKQAGRSPAAGTKK